MMRLRVPTLGVGHRGLAIARAPPAPCREREQAAGLKLLEQIEALAGLQPAVISLPVEKLTDGRRQLRTAQPAESNDDVNDQFNFGRFKVAPTVRYSTFCLLFHRAIPCTITGDLSSGLFLPLAPTVRSP